jgi:2-keto-4-pentenoate hydratase/2-oxohepta-3-ene-1,7-dioic acid hydratase in catechol pathway
MRLVSYNYKQRQCLAVRLRDMLLIPSLIDDWPEGIDSMLALIEGGPELLAQLQERVVNAPASSRIPLDRTRLTAPIPTPRKNLICLGWNYGDHAKESAAASKRNYRLPEHPVVFTKAVTSVTGPYADIPFDGRVSTQIDWEVELGVIIGMGGRGIAVDNALRHVFGYTVINDISAAGSTACSRRNP